MHTLDTIEKLLSDAEVPSVVSLTEALQSMPLDSSSDSDRREVLNKRLLIEALHAAVSIEFATIPPYLCALWSIKDEMHPVATSIREIVQEEMLHMILVCNILAGLGEAPRLNSCIPNYPTELPRNVHSGLVISLAGLSLSTLETFMAIEQPDNIIEHGHISRVRDGLQASTIGQFYVGIESALDALTQKVFSTENQIGGPPVSSVVVPTSLQDCIIANVDEAKLAIHVIREQGEGSTSTPEDSGSDDLAHFYRFEELFVGQKLECDPNTGTYAHGENIEFPTVWPMAPVPPDGYDSIEVPQEVEDLLTRFDTAYSKMIDSLQASWGREGLGAFVASLGFMFELEKYAKPLMQIPIKLGSDITYGPCFRYRQGVSWTKTGG